MAFIDRNLNELESLAGSAFQFYEEKDYDSAICCLEDLIETSGKLILALEELEESQTEGVLT